MTISERPTGLRPGMDAPAAEPRTPGDPGWIFTMTAGAVALVAVTFLGRVLGWPTDPLLALLAVAVAVTAERAADPRAALGCAVLAFPIGDGFVQNHTGELTWAVGTDLPLVAGLLGAAALGLAIGVTRLARRRGQRMRPFYGLLRESAAGTPGADGRHR